MNDIDIRIGLKFELKELATKICEIYNFGKYIDSKVIEVGYEDYNFCLNTNKGKFFVKVFNKERTTENIKNYLDRLEIINSVKSIDAPHIYKVEGSILSTIKVNDVVFNLCVFEWIEGQTFFDLNETPSKEDIINIANQMIELHKIKEKVSFIYDKWAIINYLSEYEYKREYIPAEYKLKFEKLYNEFKNINLAILPKAFVHGDIISSNIIKSDKGKLYIIDYSVSNYLPRIIDLVVSSYNLLLDSEDFQKTKNNIRLLIDEYENKNLLDAYEKECIPLLFEIANAINILQINYIIKDNNPSKEDKYWLDISYKGLEYSKEIWKDIL